MSEILLTIVILILAITLAVSQYINFKEREKMMKIFIAKSLREVTDNEVMEKQKPVEDTKPIEYIPLDAEDDVLFDKHIKREISDAQEEYEKTGEFSTPI